MCSRYTLTKEDKEIAAAYNAKLENPFQPKKHIAITDTSLVIAADKPDLLQPMHFSIVPYYAKTKNELIKYSLFNTRSEDIYDSKTFRPLLVKNKTCLIPADAFIEWHTVGKAKDPYRIFVKDRSIFSFAGLYSRWIDPLTKESYFSFSIMTTNANQPVAAIHNYVQGKPVTPDKARMPVILEKKDEHLWLSSDIAPAEKLTLCKPYHDDLMDAIHVSSNMNIVKTESGEWALPQNSI